MRKEAGQVVARELDLSSEQRCGRVASALVMDADRMIFGESGQSEQILRAEVQDATVARGGEVEGAGALAHLLDEFPHRADRRIAFDGADVWIELEQRQHREIVPLVRHLGIDRRQDRVGANAPDKQRVAVRRGGLHRHRADRSRGADAVYDHDRLIVEIFLRMLRKNSA